LSRLLGKNRDIDQEYISARQNNFKAAAGILIIVVVSLRLFLMLLYTQLLPMFLLMLHGVSALNDVSA
jgi:hypothetical protein